MQTLSSALCTVEITEDPTYTVDSVDNRPYDQVLNPRGYRRSDFTCAFSIRMVLPDCTRTLALVGEGYAVANDCAVLEENQLLVLQNRDLTRIAVPGGQVLAHTHLDRFGVFNSLYPMPGGYLVVGELEVFRMDRDFHEQWRYGAHGVITSWKMQSDHILLWEEETTYDTNAKTNRVKLGFDGNPIGAETPAASGTLPRQTATSSESPQTCRQRLRQWLNRK